MPSPWHKLPRRLPVPLLVVALLGCQESNFEPVAPQLLEPPEVYQAWWGEVESCIGARAPFARIRWFEAERLVDREDGTDHLGAWVSPHSIYVRSDALLYRAAVKHEMVHELLQRREHESLFFEACAGL